MKYVYIILFLSLIVSNYSSASTPQADESNPREEITTTTQSSENNNNSAIKNNNATPTKSDAKNQAETKHSLTWTDIKSSTKPFGYGMLFGIVCSILCIYLRPDKYIWKKFMERLSKFIENQKEKEWQENPTQESVPTPSPASDEQPIPTPKPMPEPELKPALDPNPDSNPKPTPDPKPTIVINPTTFAIDADNWSVIGTSVIGNSHISMKLPCQDNCKYEYIGDGWGIAVTSDGAGSAKRSEIGSKIVVERAIVHFKQLIEEKGWRKNNELPTDAIWTKYAYTILHRIYQEIVAVAKTKELACKDLSATAIVLIHTPMGVLCTHIGDGRAGYRNTSGEWKALVTPHKGEEANQTIFITSDFWTIPNYMMSDVFVPESIVVREKLTAFTLMSDGCEHTAWECNLFDAEKNKYYDPNKPYAKFYDSLSKTLVKYHNEEIDMNRRKEQWQLFIIEGNQSLEKEPDDKTLILGVLCN